ELSSLSDFTSLEVAFLEQLTANIGIVLNSIEATMQTEGLLKQSQQLAGELQTQQKELQQTNEQLELKARELAEQNVEVERKNQEIEQARRALEEKASELALTSKYKSEFLANMSHELRTPLNSLLILSKLLAENTQGNLSEKQVEFARSIHHAGSDLLGLINDILDLSKIESGTVTLDIGETSFTSLRDHMDRTFSQIAQDKKLDFEIMLDPELPRSMFTDDKRLQQIIKNLLSNAFKFTDKGKVLLSMERVQSGWSTANDRLNKAGPVLAFSVRDTGIGIPEEKQRIIFEAFQQADGTTSRKYGGTGLGLSISREITRLLGGELTVSSTPGRGSTFTLYLPLNFVPAAGNMARPMTQTVRAVAASEPLQEILIDDRDSINRGDAVVLIVEDDQRFAEILLNMAREGGFKGIVTGEGASVVPMAKRFRPDAITLDIGLPDMDGFALLDLLKRNPDTRHIPVHVISADEENRLGLSIGAYGYSGKPVERDAILATFDEVKSFGLRPKRLLAIEPGSPTGSLANLFGEDDVEVESLTSVDEAEQAILDNGFDCIVLDLSSSSQLPLGDLVKTLAVAEEPVVLFLPRDPNEEERGHIAQLARRSEPFRIASSTAQLQDDIALILHRPFENLPLNAQAALQQLRRCDPLLAGKKVVVIDDDIRNIFSLTSALEEHGVELHYAESGRSGIEILQRLPDANAVLVDIMMPGMDGYQTMQEIRAMPQFATLPVIAVTAKAMKGDRQKCIEAGASDYVAKPVDIDQLVSVLRVWFQRVGQTIPAMGVAGDNVVTFRSVAGQN
ncbi:MAG TPA: response regulator, partial [Micropepsaceae bacterium]|nr:response regulator [Micropepsaceae bacterium]